MSAENPVSPSAARQYQPTPHTTPTRYRERARYDRATVHGILDEAITCHLGYVTNGRPVVLPTTYARVGEVLYLHGSTGAGPMLATARSSLPICVTISLVDELVLARSWLHHSMSYRSVVVLGSARPVTDRAEKLRALRAILEHIAAGRAADSRPPNARELAATGVLAVDLVDVSAKVRTGGPVDDPEDLDLPHWAGTIPLTLAAGSPKPADDLDPAVAVPPYVSAYRRPSATDTIA